ncbi:MAG: hypothetical protein HEQ23_15810 [Tepidisphaera sp.]
MESLLGPLVTLMNFLLVVFGFSSIIFVHELGHFLAARWAGIRVLAFAIGMGPAVVSYRPGLGWRRGSSEREAFARQASGQRGLSPTEYRLNWLPIGGYVRMLGQDDADPTAISDESDSYQRCAPWKRMIVISAGVVMNIITAAVLFVIVFSAGLPVMPAAIGDIEPGRPAANAIASNAAELSLKPEDAHLRPGDTIALINGERPNSFSDVMLAATMARRGVPLSLVVEREGLPAPMRFSIVPEVDRLTGLLGLGLDAPRSGEIPRIGTNEENERFGTELDRLGLVGVRPGMRLVRAGSFELPPGAPADAELPGARYSEAFRASGGMPVALSFVDGTGSRIDISVPPVAKLEQDLVRGRLDAPESVQHLLGLMPVMTVARIQPQDSERVGLRAGDIFARLGTIEFPNLSQGMAEIQGHSTKKEIPITVLRADGEGGLRAVDLIAPVNSEGRIGFNPGTTADTGTYIAAAPEGFVTLREPAKVGPAPAAKALDLRPGSRIVAVAGEPVSNFGQIRAALLKATKPDAAESTVINLTIELPAPGSPRREVTWLIPAADAVRLHKLGWQAPTGLGIFGSEEVMLRAASPADALRLGLRETRRVMLQTYITFARLFEGTVKVEHLQGPVGIAHVGTLIAARGTMWLLFFLALISVNLAVVNFLPLPIVDGGQFLMILYEQIRGRPLPLKAQEMVSIAGLVFLGAMFLLVTFNDVKRLFGM